MEKELYESRLILASQVFFGDPWFPLEEGDTFSPTPVGSKCLFCGMALVAGDQGRLTPAYAAGQWTVEPQHRECALRNVVGGIEHLRAGPHPAGACYIGSTLTYRESALQAWDWMQRKGGSVGDSVR